MWRVRRTTAFICLVRGEPAISATEILLHIAGGAALLLWSVRMVRTGIMRGFGAALRRWIAYGARNRLRAFLMGLGVTGLTQSSTATALLAVSFVERQAIAVAPALAVMLGANVGTTLMAQILSFDVGWLPPLLILIGVALFMSASEGRWRHLGRTLVGGGLMLLSLELVTAASEPLRASPTLVLILSRMAEESLLALIVGAALTWLAHSSLAIVLLVMSLAVTGVMPLDLAFALVLGANIGGAIAPLAISFRSSPVARRVPAGNLLTRFVGALVLLPLLPETAALIAALDPEPARQVANFHTAFNLATAVVFLPLTNVVAAICARILPAAAPSEDEGQPRYLDADALETPSVALAGAARETLRMGDVVEDMLRRTIDAFRRDDLKLVAAIEAEDDAVDRLHEAIKLYLTKLSQAELDAAEGQRFTEILSFTTNLEHVGDIIDKNLMELARKKIKNRTSFSEAGFAEICAFHGRVVDNLRLALNLFMSGDPRLARRLLAEKVAIRDAELSAAESHLGRLRAGRPESIESSSLHLDLIRDLKRVNSHLTSVAYPILEATGELSASRLKRLDAGEPGAAPMAQSDAGAPGTG